MIDYEKLKQAHLLMEKLPDTLLCHYFFTKNRDRHEFAISFLNDNQVLEFKNIDDLLEGLIELTRPKGKYKIGDEVWLLDSEYKPICLHITDIDDDCNGDGVVYKGKRAWWLEELLYPTKLALIEAQMEYWRQMLHDHYNEFGFRSFEPFKQIPACMYTSQHSSSLKKDDESTHNDDVSNVSTCQHEPEVEAIWHLTIEGCQYKCTKCGEFYI